MAIDVLSAMLSVESERTFSGGWRTISWDRANLGGTVIGQTECLMSWDTHVGFVEDQGPTQMSIEPA